jgi:hypothetical protein
VVAVIWVAAAITSRRFGHRTQITKNVVAVTRDLAALSWGVSALIQIKQNVNAVTRIAVSLCSMCLQYPHLAGRPNADKTKT